jgi:hypothetical protein
MRLSREEYVICDRCRSHMGLVATVTDESDGRTVQERVFLMLPGWRKRGSVVAEPPAARDHRLRGYVPKVLPRRFGRPRGKRGPAFLAPSFPEFGSGALTLECSQCGRRHEVTAADLQVPGMHDLSLVET